MNDLEKLFEHAPEGAVELKDLQVYGYMRWFDANGDAWDGSRWYTPTEDFKPIATRPQPEPESNPFKVGDKVKRIEGDFQGMRIGDIGTVSELCGSTGICLKEYQRTHASFNFELVKEQPRKTVEDAVDAFPDGFPKELSFPGEQGWWFNSNRELVWLDQRGLGRKLTIVCNQSEFEACVAAKANSEPEWTHAYTDDTGEDVECIVLAEYEEWAWVQDAGTIETINKSWLKPIKPTISKAEAWDYAVDSGLAAEYIQEKYTITN